MYSKNDDYWKRVKLGELSTLFSGGTPSTRVSEYWDGNIPWLSSGETRSSYITTTERKITPQGVSESSTKLAKCSDVVVASAGQGTTRGQASFCKIDTYINQSIVAIRADKTQLDPHFLYFNLKNRYQELRNISDSHSSRGSLTTKLLSNLEIPLPGIDEQKAIARILSSLDNKIELNRQMNGTLEQIAQALFKRWFIDFEFPDENGNPYKSSGGEMVESELGEIPLLWQIKTIEEVASVKGGGTPRTNNEQYWKEGQINWATPKDLSGLQFPILLNTERLITSDGLASITSELLPPDTLLLSSRAPIGYLAIAKVLTAINQGIIAVICNKGISHLFMLNWLKFNLEYIKSVANGSTFMEVSKSNFRTLKIIIPDVRVLELFESTVKGIYALMTNNDINTTELKRVRDSLLPKLMSRRIRV